MAETQPSDDVDADATHGAEDQPLRDRPNEMKGLAEDLFETYRRRVEYYKDRLGLSAEDAVARVEKNLARDAGDDDFLDELRVTPPKKVNWPRLLSAMQTDPEAAMEEWERIQSEARAQLERGHDAAWAVHLRTPWQKAQFYAIRESFIEEWQPRGGVEQRLIDTLAQTYVAWQYWLDQLHGRALVQAEKEERQQDRTARWKPPTLEEAEAEEQAAKMADRFHRMFMRTLRGLRDLRRYTPNITIQNSGQVNIAENQQVNTTSESSSRC